jgi:hypothetical protein
MNTGTNEKKLLVGSQSLPNVRQKHPPPGAIGSDIPLALQKQLEVLSKRTNSPLRDLNMDTLTMLKSSGFLGKE